MKSPLTKLLLVAAAVVSFATVATIAGATNRQQPGVHNGVITACVEPLTKGNRATSGDLNFLVCLKGAGRSRGTSGGRGGRQARRVPRAPKGQQVRRAPKGLRDQAAEVRARKVPPGPPGSPGPQGPPALALEYGVAAVDVTLRRLPNCDVRRVLDRSRVSGRRYDRRGRSASRVMLPRHRAPLPSRGRRCRTALARRSSTRVS